MSDKTKDQILAELGIEDVSDRARHGVGVIAGATDANGNPRIGTRAPEPEDPEPLRGDLWRSADGSREVKLFERVEADATGPARWLAKSADGAEHYIAASAFVGGAWELIKRDPTKAKLRERDEWNDPPVVRMRRAGDPEAARSSILSAVAVLMAMFDSLRRSALALVEASTGGVWAEAVKIGHLMESVIDRAGRDARKVQAEARAMLPSTLTAIDDAVLASLFGERAPGGGFEWISGDELVHAVSLVLPELPPQLFGQGVIEALQRLLPAGFVEAREQPNGFDFRLAALGADLFEDDGKDDGKAVALAFWSWRNGRRLFIAAQTEARAGARDRMREMAQLYGSEIIAADGDFDVDPIRSNAKLCDTEHVYLVTARVDGILRYATIPAPRVAGELFKGDIAELRRRVDTAWAEANPGDPIVGGPLTFEDALADKGARWSLRTVVFDVDERPVVVQTRRVSAADVEIVFKACEGDGIDPGAIGVEALVMGRVAGSFTTTTTQREAMALAMGLKLHEFADLIDTRAERAVAQDEDLMLVNATVDGEPLAGDLMDPDLASAALSMVEDNEGSMGPDVLLTFTSDGLTTPDGEPEKIERWASFEVADVVFGFPDGWSRARAQLIGHGKAARATVPDAVPDEVDEAVNKAVCVAEAMIDAELDKAVDEALDPDGDVVVTVSMTVIGDGTIADDSTVILNRLDPMTTREAKALIEDIREARGGNDIVSPEVFDVVVRDGIDGPVVARAFGPFDVVKRALDRHIGESGLSWRAERGRRLARGDEDAADVVAFDVFERGWASEKNVCATFRPPTADPGELVAMIQALPWAGEAESDLVIQVRYAGADGNIGPVATTLDAARDLFHHMHNGHSGVLTVLGGGFDFDRQAAQDRGDRLGAMVEAARAAVADAKAKTEAELDASIAELRAAMHKRPDGNAEASPDGTVPEATED